MKGLLKRNKKTFIFMTSLLLFLIGADSAWDTLSYFKAPNDYYILKVLLSNGKYIGRGE